MTGVDSAVDARSFIIERLIGESGEASHVIAAGRGMAERAVPAIQARLDQEIGATLTVGVQGVEVDRTAAARERAGEVFAMAVISSPVSSDAVTLVMDAQAIAMLVSALFGGDPEQAAAPIGRDLSQIETEVATLVLGEFAQALNGSGKRSLELRLPMPRALSGAEARRRLLRDGAAVRIDFSLSTPADTGTVSVTVPQRVLLALRGGGAAEDTAAGPDWRQRFSEEVMRSSVRLEATMPLARLSLGELTALQAGQVFEIEETARSRANLSARGKTLFVCEFGKLGQNYTVRINNAYDAGQDFIDGLLPG